MWLLLLLLLNVYFQCATESWQWNRKIIIQIVQSANCVFLSSVGVIVKCKQMAAWAATTLILAHLTEYRMTASNSSDGSSIIRLWVHQLWQCLSKEQRRSVLPYCSMYDKPWKSKSTRNILRDGWGTNKANQALLNKINEGKSKWSKVKRQMTRQRRRWQQENKTKLKKVKSHSVYFHYGFWREEFTAFACLHLHH